MIDEETLKLVEGEMARLHHAIDKHRRRLSMDERYAKFHRITGGPETAAIRRASTDLSQALVALRRR